VPFDAHKNFAVSAVLVPPSPAVSGTALTVASSQGGRFPAVPFNATVWPAAALPTPLNAEIVRVTARVGDVLTLTRAQEATTARAILAGDQIAATITVKTLTDIEAGAGTLPLEQTAPETGVLHNYNLIGPSVLLRCTGAAPSFSGFMVNGAAPYAGCRATVICVGTSAKVLHQDAGSTAAHAILTPSIAGQIIGANGRMDLVYDATTARWREALVDPGVPLDIPYAAGNFTAAPAGTWVVEAVDLVTAKYVQNGRRLTLFVTVITSSVTGTPNNLRVAIPGGFVATAGTQYGSLAPAYDNNVFTSAIPNTSTSDSNTVVRINRSDFANWAASANLTYAYLSGHTVVID
jgi:hypothetical protein